MWHRKMNPQPLPSSSSTPLMEISMWSFGPVKLPLQAETLFNFVWKGIMIIQFFIEWYLDLWFREVTLLEQEWVDSQFTMNHLRMSFIKGWSLEEEACSQWQIVEKILTNHNFLSHLENAIIWTRNIQYLGRLLEILSIICFQCRV